LSWDHCKQRSLFRGEDILPSADRFAKLRAARGLC
jgi:hypothetical protein